MLSVIVVDDEAVARTMLGGIFRRQGRDVHLAASGAAALQAIADTPFDVVVTDLVLDDMGGIDVLSEAKRKNTYQVELWGRTVLAAVALFLLDQFLRRVRLFEVGETAAVTPGSVQAQYVTSNGSEKYSHELDLVLAFQEEDLATGSLDYTLSGGSNCADADANVLARREGTTGSDCDPMDPTSCPDGLGCYSIGVCWRDTPLMRDGQPRESLFG